MTEERLDYQQPLNDEERRREEEFKPDPQWLAEMKRLKNFNDALWKLVKQDKKWP